MICCVCTFALPVNALADPTRPIALDSGHGGSDPGALANNLVERDLNWEITQACKAELERQGYTVIVVNTGSQNYKISQRVQRAVDNSCPVIISFHNNAWDGKSQEKRGSCVLVPNNSSYENGLYDIGQRFAVSVTSKLEENLEIPVWKDGSYERNYPAGSSASIYPDGSVSDYYGIVRYARSNGIFGAIIEHAYLDNADDAAILKADGTLEQLGILDAQAIIEFYDEFCAYADESARQRASQPKWIQSGSRWWYRYGDGSYPASQLLEINGKTYGFDASGWMVTGWKQFDGKWYWFNNSGAMGKSRWIGSYYVGADGIMLTSTWTPDGYYVDANGKWVPNAKQKTSSSAKDMWIKSGSRWWYRHADGSYTRNGWEKIGGSWYLFDSKGWMLTGWAKLGGKWYYLKSSGAMATGWIKLGEKWYYLGADGAMYESRYTPDGYWVNGNGEWVKGSARR